MDNTSEEFVNSTLDFLPLIIDPCAENPYGFIFLYSISSLCFLLVIPVNLWFLSVDFGTKKKIKGTQVFALNHTIMEIMYILDMVIEAVNRYSFNDIILYRVRDLFTGLSWTGRPLFQICICIEQYLAVIHPVAFLRYKGIKYRVAASVPTWLMGSAYSVYGAQNFPDYIYTSVFIIALTVICFCCISVLCALKKPGPGDNHITKQAGRAGRNQQKRNAFNIIFSALLLILFTYLPPALYIFINTGKNYVLIICIIGPSCISLNLLGMLITALLKFYKESKKKSPKYRKEIKVTT